MRICIEEICAGENIPTAVPTASLHAPCVEEFTFFWEDMRWQSRNPMKSRQEQTTWIFACSSHSVRGLRLLSTSRRWRTTIRTYVRLPKRYVHACTLGLASMAAAPMPDFCFQLMRHRPGCLTEPIPARELCASHVMCRIALASYISILHKLLAN